MKRIMSVFIATIMILTMTVGCSKTTTTTEGKTATAGFTPEKKYAQVEINLGTTYAKGSIIVTAAEKFKEIVEAESKGVMKINIISGGSLGSSEDINEAVSTNAIQMASVDAMVIYAYAPDYYFIECPFILKNFEHYLAVWNSHLGDEIKALTQKKNVKMYEPFYRGNRIFTSNKPIKIPADLNKMKLRLPVIDYWITLFSKLGAAPISLPLNDLYVSLQTGLAEASEGPPDQIANYKLDEVQKYLTITKHDVVAGYFIISDSFYNGLNVDSKALIDKAVKESNAFATKYTTDNEDIVINDLGKKGMIVTTPDMAPFIKIIEPTLQDLFKSKWTVTTYEEVMNLAK